MKSGELGDQSNLDSPPGGSKADRAYKGYKGGVSAGNRWDGEIDGIPVSTRQVKQGREAAPDLG
jgi:hypothetical protein